MFFIGFNSCNLQFGIACVITIIVQVVVNVGLLFTWSCMCLMNSLGDCDLLEKVVNNTNVHEHNDVTVSIIVQQFRSHFPKGRYGYTTEQQVAISPDKY